MTSSLDRQDEQRHDLPLGATSLPLSDGPFGPAVLADDPCEAGPSGADPEYAGMYLHARYYDPQLGIFLSPDPIGVAGGMNAYGYAAGDPVNLADRSGLWECSVSYGGTGGPNGSGQWSWRCDFFREIGDLLNGLFGGGDSAGCPGGAQNCRPPVDGTPNGHAVPRDPAPTAPGPEDCPGGSCIGDPIIIIEPTATGDPDRGGALPGVDVLAQDLKVRQALDLAWEDSAPGDPLRSHEEGGWIFYSPASRALWIERAPSGFRGTMGRLLDTPPQVAPGYYLVADFHTHPELRVLDSDPPYDFHPSPSDIDRANELGAPGIVRTYVWATRLPKLRRWGGTGGVIVYGPPTRVVGPGRPGGYPNPR